MQLYNTLTKQKEEFIPYHPGEVRIYDCGPTVYNYFHIGNARNFIVFDVLRRYLTYKGYQVIFVQNFTDIDDKMIRKAQEENMTVKELGDHFIAEYFKDADALGIERATVHPRATEHIPDIIDLIQQLEIKGFAYPMNGDMYFDTHAFPSYGKLSGQCLEDLELGARIESNEEKRNPTDFALWKAKKEGEPAWESPWGWGRPGWHIECSAMSMKYLGETIDIHAGGQDLIFPHHENEIAQSEGATGQPFVHYWLHNGYINTNNQKMSKSSNNFFMVRDVLTEYDSEVVRFFLLSAHYRNPVNFSADLLEQAKSALERLYNAKINMEYLMEHAKERTLSIEETSFLWQIKELQEKFMAAMEDDINTADALGILFDLVREANTFLKPEHSQGVIQGAYEALLQLSHIIGILQKHSIQVDDSVETLVQQRQQARKDKNWALADQIRDQLNAMDITLEDTPQGVRVVSRGRGC